MTQRQVSDILCSKLHYSLHLLSEYIVQLLFAGVYEQLAMRHLFLGLAWMNQPAAIQEHGLNAAVSHFMHAFLEYSEGIKKNKLIYHLSI